MGLKFSKFQFNHPSQTLIPSVVWSCRAGAQIAKSQQGENTEIESKPLETHCSNTQTNILVLNKF